MVSKVRSPDDSITQSPDDGTPSPLPLVFWNQRIRPGDMVEAHDVKELRYAVFDSKEVISRKQFTNKQYHSGRWVVNRIIYLRQRATEGILSVHI